MMDALLEIKGLVTSPSEATRHASTINFQDLGALESALHVSFVPVRADECDESVACRMTDDETEIEWDTNVDSRPSRKTPTWSNCNHRSMHH